VNEFCRIPFTKFEETTTPRALATEETQKRSAEALPAGTTSGLAAKKQRRSGQYVAVRQTWVENFEDPEPCSMKRLCNPCCPAGAVSSGAIGDAEEYRDGGTSTRGGDSSNDDQELGPLRVQPSSRTASGSGTTVYTDQASIPQNFVELGPDNPWLVCRSPAHGGKLFWLHRTTQETTWRQPLPRLMPLPKWSTVHAPMRETAFAVIDPIFYGAPADPIDPKARTGICGKQPLPAPLRKTCDTLSPEHQLYPKRFFDRVGIKRFVMCEDLKYNGQRRRDVPDLSSGTLYIDVGDRAVRRKRHSFHHELWHMVDYHLLGNAFESHDAEWCEHNPRGFNYGNGGKFMRTDSSSSQLSSSPSPEFLNRYSTSSIAEDKAEVWASLMCYQQVLKTPALQAKAALLKKRALNICSEMDERWWAKVVHAQQQSTDHWEVHYAEAHRGRAFWCNWVTEERRWEKPAETASTA